MGLGEFLGLGLPWTPWREPFPNFKWQKETADTLLKEIKDITPTNESGLERFHFLTIGIHGHGKSSFINTVASIIVGEKTTVCNAAPSEENVTTRYRKYEFPGQYGHHIIGDICGPLSTTRNIQPMVDDIKLIIKGRIKKGYKFDPNSSIQPDDEHYVQVPKSSDETNCVVVVIDSLQAYELPASFILNIKTIMGTIHEMNIPVIAVLTKGDLLSNHVKYGIDSIFRCKKIQQAVKDAARQLVIPVPKVYPVVNFEEMDSFTWKETIPVLLVLKSILRMAQLHSHNMKE